MEAFALLAEQKIKAAIRDGEFDDLPLMGKPLHFENDLMIPAALRMGFQIDGAILIRDAIARFVNILPGDDLPELLELRFDKLDFEIFAVRSARQTKC